MLKKLHGETCIIIVFCALLLVFEFLANRLFSWSAQHFFAGVPPSTRDEIRRLITVGVIRYFDCLAVFAVIRIKRLSLCPNVKLNFPLNCLPHIGIAVLLIAIAIANGPMFADNATVSVLTKTASLFMLGPIAEELVFRGIIFGWIRSRSTVVIAIYASSLLFMLAHFGSSTFSLLLAFFGAILMAIFYEKFRSLLLCIGIHALYNAFFIIMSSIAKGGS